MERLWAGGAMEGGYVNVFRYGEPCHTVGVVSCHNRLLFRLGLGRDYLFQFLPLFQLAFSWLLLDSFGALSDEL